MYRGYVKLWRKTIESGLLSNPNACTLFLYFLIRANREPGNSIKGSSVVPVARGQLITSFDSIANDTGLTHRNARTSLKFLEKLQIVTCKPTRQYSLVTLTNWDVYQVRDTQGDTQGDKQATCKRHTSDTQGDILQEEENLKRSKELKNKKLSSKLQTEKAITELFENYTDNPELIEALNGYVEMRKEIKSPLTERAAKQALKKIDTYAQDDQAKIDLLDTATLGNWKGIYEPKKSFNGNGFNNAPKDNRVSPADIFLQASLEGRYDNE